MNPSTTHPLAWAPAQVRWRTPRLWSFVQGVARVVVPIFCRLQVTGEVPAELRAGPLIVAGNHIANCDPMIATAATRIAGLSPRILATGGIFRAPVVGPLMRRAGHIPVDRGLETVVNAVPAAAAALREGAVVFIYPEGRIGLDPGMWPERPKSGVARLALQTGAPIIPMAMWGSQSVVSYHGRGAMLRRLLRSVVRRPVVRVHFGPAVDLSDLREGAVGHAQQASDRMMTAVIAALTPLRAGEPRLPAYRDPTRPLSTARTYRSPGTRRP
jgi:1-acyl-sn-glycerol-3-phosphate acyltransferase